MLHDDGLPLHHWRREQFDTFGEPLRDVDNTLTESTRVVGVEQMAAFLQRCPA
jgi:hypothetical protein